MKEIRYKGKTVAYTDLGRGKAIVLLHGFTESSRIWTKYANQLSKRYRVISIDLPGHGKTASFGEVHTMEMMADMVRFLLKKLRTGKATMVGHSMGGYVALAFARKHASMISGICLFHSHCFADSEAERENRDRTISIVRHDGFGFVAQFIPGLFPKEVHRRFSGEIEKLIRRASKMDNAAIIAALEGMKNRNDFSEWMRETKLPVLFIIGQKDSRAPLNRLSEMISLPARSELLLLRDCGHMGYIEQPAACLRAIEGFARKSG